MISAIKDYWIGFRIAWGMLTTIPFATLNEFRQGYNGKAVAMYPIVGLFLGLIIYLISLPTFYILPKNVGITLLFFLYIHLYGALHLDGFADTCDALFSRKSPEIARKIMKEPQIGALGAIYTVLLLILKLSTFFSIDLLQFAAIPMISRFTAVIAIWKSPYSGNMSKYQKTELSKIDIIIASLSLVLVLPLIGFSASLLIPLSVITFYLFNPLLEKRFGSLSGDSYGFLIEISEVLSLLFLITINHIK